MTATKKKVAPKKRAPAKKAPKKVAVAPINPIIAAGAGALVYLQSGGPTMTVTMLTQEYDGPKPFDVAVCSWTDPVAHVAFDNQRFKVSELVFVSDRNGAVQAMAERSAADQEWLARDNAERRLAIQIAEARVYAEEEDRARQAAAQERKGAV
jgi:hypothetical protein